MSSLYHSTNNNDKTTTTTKSLNEVSKLQNNNCNIHAAMHAGNSQSLNISTIWNSLFRRLCLTSWDNIWGNCVLCSFKKIVFLRLKRFRKLEKAQLHVFPVQNPERFESGFSSRLQEGAHHTRHAGVSERRLRGGAGKRPRETLVPAQTRHRDLLHSAISPQEGVCADNTEQSHSFH